MRQRPHVFCLLAFLCAIALPTRAAAQETTGTIIGTVSDGSGGVLPGVTVVLKNMATGQTIERVTNEQGQYTAPLLPVGTYEVTFTLTGFEQRVVRGVALSVNDRIVDTAPEVREFVDPGNVTVTAKGPTGVTATNTFRVFAQTTFKADVPTLQPRAAGRQPFWIAVSAVAVGGGAIALGAGSGAVRLFGGVAVVGGIALFILAPRKRTIVVPMMITNESTGTGVALIRRF